MRFLFIKLSLSFRAQSITSSLLALFSTIAANRSGNSSVHCQSKQADCNLVLIRQWTVCTRPAARLPLRQNNGELP